jgi:hypothetical protein
MEEDGTGLKKERPFYFAAKPQLSNKTGRKTRFIEPDA